MDPKQPTGFSAMPTYGPSNNSEPPASDSSDDSPAVELIRQKIEHLYEKEPPAREERAEVKELTPAGRSRHQQFMYKLSASGLSLAEIQTAWHNYYADLSDSEKHEVWQEFYAEHDRTSHYARSQHPPHAHAEQAKPTKPVSHKTKKRAAKLRTVSQLREQIASTVNVQGKLKTKQHLQSLMFGLGMGSLVVLILLFGFFNERVIAPFISPSKKVSSTPIIIDQSTAAVSANPEIIIPKINVEIPVDYSQTSVDETDVQKALEKGILHYPTTVEPGEKGNAAFFGHSSNNIFNPGKYKFAFVLLRKLEPGDVFYLTKDRQRYVYRVYAKKVVEPTEVSVLGRQPKIATAALITCDPPGTSLKRLVVFGEQISPSPAKNKASHLKDQQQKPRVLPSNSPSLWQRIKEWLIN